MRLIADLHIAPRTVEFLKTLGHDVLRVPEVLPATAPDTEIIAYAVQARRTILTQDLDFSAEIALSGRSYPSVLLLRLSSSRIESVNRVLMGVLSGLEQDVLDGALITIEDHRVRLRRLPLSAS
jgi:predicted nuclease of predicted toxin-antitoxin system